MTKALSKRMSIYLSIKRETVSQYFNVHDAAPLYKRSLRHDFIDYIEGSVKSYKKYSTINYKIRCSEEDRALVDPVMYAIKRHYYTRHKIKAYEFDHFKRSSFHLLIGSMVLVMVLQILITVVGIEGTTVGSILHNYADVFSWVVMWQPIYRLVFMWNPYKKEISLLYKLTHGDAIIINSDNEVQEKVTKLKVSA